MAEYKLKKRGDGRILAASLVSAAAVIGSAGLHALAGEWHVGIWLAAAVAMMGPLLAAVILWPRLEEGGWLFTTAVFLAVPIVIPWAFIDPARWAAEILPQLGMWANVLFSGLWIAVVGAGRPPRKLSWALTGFYLLILLILPIWL